MERAEQTSNPDSGSPIDPTLRQLLVCPLDHGDLDDIERTLVCAICGRVYPVVDGKPDMVVRPIDRAI